MNFTDILRYINQAAAIAQPILSVANYFVGRRNLRKSRRAASDAIDANRAIAAEEARNLAEDTKRQAEIVRKTAVAQASARGTLDPRNLNQFASSFGAANRFSRRELDIDLARIGRRQQIQNQNFDAQQRQVDADANAAMNQLIGQSAGNVFKSFANITGQSSPFKTLVQRSGPPTKSGATPKPKVQYDIFGFKIN